MILLGVIKDPTQLQDPPCTTSDWLQSPGTSRYDTIAIFEIIDILQEISSMIHHDICVTEEIQNLLTALNPFHRDYKTLSINFI